MIVEFSRVESLPSSLGFKMMATWPVGRGVPPDWLASTNSDAAPSLSHFMSVCEVPASRHSSGGTLGVMMGQLTQGL